MSFAITVLAIIGLVFIVSAANLLERPIDVKSGKIDVRPVAGGVGDNGADQEVKAPDQPNTDGQHQDAATSDPEEIPLPPKQSPTIDPVSPAQVHVDPSTVQGGISLDEAYRLYEEGALFIDTRHTELFNEGHVAGAFRMTVENVTTGNFGEVLTYLQGDPEQVAVIYCEGGECDESAIVRRKLIGSFPNLKIMVDGFPGWKARGYPTQ